MLECSFIRFSDFEFLPFCHTTRGISVSGISSAFAYSLLEHTLTHFN